MQWVCVRCSVFLHSFLSHTHPVYRSSTPIAINNRTSTRCWHPPYQKSVFVLCTLQAFSSLPFYPFHTFFLSVAPSFVRSFFGIARCQFMITNLTAHAKVWVWIILWLTFTPHFIGSHVCVSCWKTWAPFFCFSSWTVVACWFCWWKRLFICSPQTTGTPPTHINTLPAQLSQTGSSTI